MRHLEGFRSAAYRILRPTAAWMVRHRFTPNVVTTIGFVTAVGAALSFHGHQMRVAGFLVLLGGVFDILDGRMAKLSGVGSKFGAFYDSTLDRIGEVAVYFGMLSLYNDQRMTVGDVGMIYLIMLAMAGSLMISYTRARAEALGLDCRVGLMARAERIVLIGGAALFFGNAWDGLVLQVVIFLLAVLTNITAFQRIVWVYRNVREEPRDAAEPPAETPLETIEKDGGR